MIHETLFSSLTESGSDAHIWPWTRRKCYHKEFPLCKNQRALFIKKTRNRLAWTNLIHLRNYNWICGQQEYVLWSTIHSKENEQSIILFMESDFKNIMSNHSTMHSKLRPSFRLMHYTLKEYCTRSMYLTRAYFRLCDICHYFNVDERPLCPLYFCVKNTGLESQQVANINLQIE